MCLCNHNDRLKLTTQTKFYIFLKKMLYDNVVGVLRPSPTLAHSGDKAHLSLKQKGGRNATV